MPHGKADRHGNHHVAPVAVFPPCSWFDKQHRLGSESRPCGPRRRAERRDGPSAHPRTAVTAPAPTSPASSLPLKRPPVDLSPPSTSFPGPVQVLVWPPCWTVPFGPSSSAPRVPRERPCTLAQPCLLPRRLRPAARSQESPLSDPTPPPEPPALPGGPPRPSPHRGSAVSRLTGPQGPAVPPDPNRHDTPCSLPEYTNALAAAFLRPFPRRNTEPEEVAVSHHG